MVRYRDGTEHMGYHQHKEDLRPPGRDMRVWIVSTGAVRTFGIMEGATDAHGKFQPTGRGFYRKFKAEPGSLIVLPSEYNLTRGHAVLPDRGVRDVRYAVNCDASWPGRNSFTLTTGG